MNTHAIMRGLRGAIETLTELAGNPVGSVAGGECTPSARNPMPPMKGASPAGRNSTMPDDPAGGGNNSQGSDNG